MMPHIKGVSNQLSRQFLPGAWCEKHRALFYFHVYTRMRPRDKNAAHICTQLHTLLFIIDFQTISESTQTNQTAHTLHKSAHTLHTSQGFAHKQRDLHTDF